MTSIPSPLKQIILDCDGVLYPTSELSLREIINGMNLAYDKLGFSPAVLAQASTESRPTKGIFNYIARACALNHTDLKDFCDTMAHYIPYNQLTPNRELFMQIQDINKRIPVCVLTNNHAAHLECVFKRLFGISTKETDIPCYDITSLFNGTSYLSKQSDEGLKTFCNILKIRPAEALLMDDTPCNIQKAREIGMPVKLITAQKNLPYHLDHLKQDMNTHHHM